MRHVLAESSAQVDAYGWPARPKGDPQNGAAACERVKNLASGYTRVGDTLYHNHRRTDYGLVSHFGILSTVLDLARFAELHADGFVCSVARARALIGFSAETSLADGFEQTVRWYRGRGWI